MSESPEKQFALRLPTDIYAEIEVWAKEEFRSANGQIVAILRDAIAERKARQRAARKALDQGGTIEGERKSTSLAAA